MNQPNYGWKFYRDYFNDVDFRVTDKKKQEEKFKPKNNAFEKARLIPLSSNSNNPQGFSLKLLYPGLLSGVGYTMGVGMVGEFKIGFYFDHTTGMPVIPGSSIKGVLRSVFPVWQGEGLNSKLKRSSKNDEQKARFVWNLISNIPNIDATKFSKKDDKTFLTENEKKIIRQIELEIFEGRNIEKELEKPLEPAEEFLGIYNADVFFDAFVEKAVEGDDEPTKDHFFGTDSITPHGDNPLRNPNPLLFLKVLPGTTWRFCFDLKDGFYLNAKQKEELFKQIILTIGIGAKTNVGYGQFEEGFEDAHVGKTGVLSRSEPKNYTGNLKSFIHPIEAIVVDQNTRKVKMIINEEPIEKTVTGKNSLTIGSLILVRLNLEGKPERIRDVTYMGDVKR